jgi:hypothetical protein
MIETLLLALYFALVRPPLRSGCTFACGTRRATSRGGCCWIVRRRGR